ncbi:efflux RND transporter periplasmic adaptor subunit [Providencia huaxiensis]|uniref:efflux RND transporter periplasmic adaptor subunit n=1 Tax=Providencia TaxID=586 RepID=UPI00189F0168|nr:MULTISPECIES: efflux RND transporter periplasmic adaptor subunit [Providencia]MBN6362882.1 efflux RND transporter periplasmic adaptor subunit [Providencia huaxiensis]QPE17750.1 efflux RND transporter periplasmic adaptor subunit [Providencia rettgeri]
MKHTFLAILCCFIMAVAQGVQAEEIRLSVTHPQKIKVADAVSLPGQFVARNEISIGSPLQQQIVTAVFVEEGEWVEKGQLLATLESPIQSAAVQQLKAEIDKAAAYIKQQEALSRQSQSELQRLSPLAKTGVISANDFGKAKNEAAAQNALLTASRAELRQLQAQLRREQSQEDKAKIIAPVAGVISERHAMSGTLSDNALLFKLIENNELEFEALAHPSELARILGDNPVMMKVNNNTVISGKLRYLSPKIEALTQLGKIRVTLTEPVQSMRLGEIGMMTYTNSPREYISLPYSAIRTEPDGQRFIFSVANDGRVEKLPVQIGKIQHGHVEILSPLAANLDVVTYAQAFLSEDDKVVPVRAPQ